MRAQIARGVRQTTLWMLEVLFFAFLLPLALAGLAGAEGSSVFFLNPGGRAGALAGAFTAVSNDAQAIFYNPAGLALVSDAEGGVMYTSRGPGFISKEHFVSTDVFFPSGEHGYGIGAGLLYENRGGVDVDGPSYTLCGALASGSTIGARIAFGLGAKYLRNVEPSVNASVIGGDFGILLNFCPVFLGFSMQNWEGTLDYGTWKEELPDVLRFSIAYVEPASGAPIAVEYRKVDGKAGSRLSAGVEVPAIHRKLYLRTGYMTDTDSGTDSFVLGFGLRLKEEADAGSGHPIGYELNVFDNLSAGGLHDLRLELRRRRL